MAINDNKLQHPLSQEEGDPHAHTMPGVSAHGNDYRTIKIRLGIPQKPQAEAQAESGFNMDSSGPDMGNVFVYSMQLHHPVLDTTISRITNFGRSAWVVERDPVHLPGTVIFKNNHAAMDTDQGGQESKAGNNEQGNNKFGSLDASAPKASASTQTAAPKAGGDSSFASIKKLSIGPSV